MVFLMAFCLAMPSFAASWRVESYLYGQSYIYGTTILTDALGNELYNISGSQWMDSDYQSTYTPNQAVSFDRLFRQAGQPQDSGYYTAFWKGYSSTGYGKNKVMVELGGTLTNQTYSETINNPVTGNTISLTTEDYKYVHGRSIWEELFLITPKNKNLIGTSASVKLYIRLNGTLDGNSTYYNYDLENFDRTSVVSSYSWSPGTVDENLSGIFTFTYGDPLYLKSSLYAQVYNAIGISDMSHTAEITGIDLPDGAKIKFLSGASSSSYGTLGGDGYGEYGTGTGAVPIPSALWLMASGLIGLVGFGRRR